MKRSRRPRRVCSRVCARRSSSGRRRARRGRRHGRQRRTCSSTIWPTTPASTATTVTISRGCAASRAGETVTGADGRGSLASVRRARGQRARRAGPRRGRDLRVSNRRRRPPRGRVRADQGREARDRGPAAHRAGRRPHPPLRARRSVVRWDAARADAAVARLHRVAREAAMQCRRARLPVVEPPRRSPTSPASRPEPSTGRSHEPGPPRARRPGRHRGRCAGSFSRAPLLGRGVAGRRRSRGWPGTGRDRRGWGRSVRLAVGHHVLRAETAAVAVAAVLVARRGSAHAG